MALRKIIFLICLIISSALSIIGFALINFWQGEIAVLINAILWFCMGKKYPAVCLLFSIIIAVTGILLGVPSIYMLLYSGFSLVCWDLTLLDISLKRNDNKQKSNFYQKIRIFSIGISLGAGFIIVFLGKLLNFKIHFLIIVILVVIVIYIIDQIIHILYKKE